MATVRTLGITLGVVVLSGGFVAARVFSMRRYGDDVERRLARKDEDSRRHHFRGRPDLELPDGS
ncbi:MAG TPA: hypothetical protein VMB82_03990 [Acidimicrobiales bacterium]|nr:hypothetical protein [Acidimicrobiales bacterium]